MSRVSVAERTRLSVFLARGLVGRLTSRITTHPIVDWPFSFGKTDRVVIAPQDLRTADSTRARNTDNLVRSATETRDIKGLLPG